MIFKIEKKEDYFIIKKKILFIWVKVYYKYTVRQRVDIDDELYEFIKPTMADIEIKTDEFKTEADAKNYVLMKKGILWIQK